MSSLQARAEEQLRLLLCSGLGLSQVKRIWQASESPLLPLLLSTAARLLSPPHPPLARAASLWLELASEAPEACDVNGLSEAIRSDLDEPEEAFRDPVSLALMDDPVVLSSGFVFDRSTVMEGGRFRFEACPMTRQPVERRAFPLVRLKAQLVDFKKRRINAILAVVKERLQQAPLERWTDEGSEERRDLLSLLDLSSQFLKGLVSSAASAYQTCALSYFECRQHMAVPREMPMLLREVGEAARACAAPPLKALEHQISSSVRKLVRREWEAGEYEGASAIAVESLKASPAMEQESAEGWLSLLVELAATVRRLGGTEEVVNHRLAQLAPCLRLLPARELCADPSSPSALSFWQLKLWSSRTERRTVGDAIARYLVYGIPFVPQLRSQAAVAPSCVLVSGAGCADANGRYHKSGEYQGAPRYIHEDDQLWLIRYMLPSGNNWWYIADKDQLNVNDGDLYRVRATPNNEGIPPLVGWDLAQDGQVPLPSFTFEPELIVAGAPAASDGHRTSISHITSAFGRLFSRPASEAPSTVSGCSDAVDMNSPLGQLLSDEFGEEVDEMLAAARLVKPAVHSVHHLPPVNASYNDHEKYTWAQLPLEDGWTQIYHAGVIALRWKDQGWGNRKGHIWARVSAEGQETEHTWHRLSFNAAMHEWEDISISLPAQWFDGAPCAGRLDLAYEVGGGGGHSLHISSGATLTLIPRHTASSDVVLLGDVERGREKLMIGDCLEVEDTHGLWSVARIVAFFEDRNLGPLALVHFEGWGSDWLMWLSRIHDVARVRPLYTMPGIGSRGAHTEFSFASIVAQAHSRLCNHHPWHPTSGNAYRPLPFRQSNVFLLHSTTNMPVEEELGVMERRHPFSSCSELASNQQLCEEVYQRFFACPQPGQL